MTGSPVSDSKVKSGAGSPSRSKRPSSSRAVGVIRVSEVGKRGGETFRSPVDQRNAIAQACARDGLKLVDVFEEFDVSGGAPLARRPGLGRAVELVESGDIGVIVVAYFDRLVRSLAVQAELLERVEAAGGKVLAVDVGEISADTASRWLSSTMLGMVSEYHRRVTAERTREAKRNAVAQGIPPFPNIPVGYRQRSDKRLERDPKTARYVSKAFEKRSNGATIKEVRAYLGERGITLSWHGVQAMLANRIYLGELRFGDMVNTESHEAIVDEVTWQRVQRMRSSRGRRPKSDRLLARLDVLRCGTCGARMVIGMSQNKYPFYRCPPVGDCPERVTISAEIAENTVIDAVQELLAGIEGSASVESGVNVAAGDLARKQEQLDAAFRTFDGFGEEQAARERLRDLGEARDRAREHHDQLVAASTPAITVSAAGDWDALTLDEQRALIRAVINRAVVRPGGVGADRITVEPRSITVEPRS